MVNYRDGTYKAYKIFGASELKQSQLSQNALNCGRHELLDSLILLF